ncbi:MAG: hypothetical protein JNK35_11420 [Phycisphaerae bacterium]|nr:hypothetical protein [Phycisphaerae bacterium]
MNVQRVVCVGLAAAGAWMGGCAGPRLTGGVSLPPGTSARIDVLGAAKVRVANGGTEALGVEVISGEMAGERSEIEPGQTRWWNPDGSRRFVVRNTSAVTVPWSYAVEGASASFVRSDAPAGR